ncbi:hypothetical protein COO60DRAFT_859797 [Scenedesmus sp. NREL 46B-D3]|nr:hypothetical protein COO60DRAFT_859797 [Scenedesmus sp. NREL 46B-D3]
MAARGGRGRGGWRGGRAGGRGGFQAPGLKDDEGNIVEAEVNAGPPPLFPAVELPHDPPELTAHDKLLGLRRADLLRYYRTSPYFLRLSQPLQEKAAKDGGSTDEVEKYSDRFKAKSQRQPGAKVHLASLLSLHPHHFPEELFSDRDRRLAARGGQAELFKRATPEDGLLSNHLALKSQQEAKGGAAPGDKPVKMPPPLLLAMMTSWLYQLRRTTTTMTSCRKMITTRVSTTMTMKATKMTMAMVAVTTAPSTEHLVVTLHHTDGSGRRSVQLQHYAAALWRCSVCWCGGLSQAQVWSEGRSAVSTAATVADRLLAVSSMHPHMCDTAMACR